jgi:hypothetical protein
MASFDDEDEIPDRFGNQNMVVETIREVFDVSNIPVGEVQRLPTPLVESPDLEDLLPPTFFPDLSTFPQPPPATAVATAKTPRQRFSYAKQYFYANSDIYLEINPAFPSPDSTPELVGYVHSCPTKNNGNVYIIKWKSLRIDGAQWPTNLLHHLKTRFQKATLHRRLKELILSCPLNNKTALPGRPRPQQAAMPPPPIPDLQPPPALAPIARLMPPPGPETPIRILPPAQPAAPIIDMTIVETPAASRRSAFAALHTAGSASAYTAISSLGHSNRSTLLEDSTQAPHRRGRTRRY